MGVGMNVTGTAIRTKLLDEFASDCLPGECDVVDLTAVLKSGQRNDLNAYSLRNINFNQILQNATFCPIPRGDSGGTKRFFAAILAGCIPVVISDNLALPFVPAVDYRGAILHVPEREFMHPKFSLLAILRSQTPEQVAAMRVNLGRIQRAITFSHGCTSLTEKYGSCSKHEDRMPDAVDHFV